MLVIILCFGVVSIKQRTIILQRGLFDRSSSVMRVCLKMLKDEWFTKCCSGDPIVLLRLLDVETYEAVGVAVMEALLKEDMVPLQEHDCLKELLASINKTEGEMIKF